MKVGQMCMKIAGRDAGRICVVLNVENQLALVDGDVRRKKVNLKHLEPIPQKIDVAENAGHDVVVKKFQELEISTWKGKN